MFNLRDPRLDAISQAGQQFGTGLGNTLVQGLLNKRLQGVLSDISPTASINEVIGKFAGANLPPEMLNQYMNPQVQQRVAQERRRVRFEELAKRKIKHGEMPQFLAELSAELADTEGAGDIMKVFMTAAQSANLANGDGNETPSTDETPNRPGKDRQTPSGRAEAATQAGPPSIRGYRNEQGQANPLAQMGVPGTSQMQGPETGDYRSNINVNAPVTQPMGPQEYQQLLSRYARDTGDYDKARELADKFQSMTQDQRTAELDRLSRDETQRTLRMAEEERARGAIESQIKSDPKFPGQGEGGQDIALRNIAIQTGMRTPGTDEQKFEAGRRAATRIYDNLNKLRGGTTRPNIAALRHPELKDYLRTEQAVVQNIINDPAIPENLKPEIAEQIRLLEAGKGNGPVETEYLINPPSPRTAKLINSAPEAPRHEIPTGMVGNSKALAKMESIKNAAVYELAESISRTISSDPKASPVIMRDRYLDKGWSEADIARAFTIAEQNGLEFSNYQREQKGELATPQRESLRTYFSEDKAANDYWNIFIQGRR